jgi:hypothetical protein
MLQIVFGFWLQLCDCSLGPFVVATPSQYLYVLKLSSQVIASVYVGNLKRIAGSRRK